MAVYLPPWLAVNPSDFVQAAAAGGRLGAEISRMRTEANIAGERNRAGLEEAQLRANTAMSGQASEQQLANARLEQAAKQSEAERALREWEVQQQIKRQQDQIDAENTRAANALAERTRYGQGMLDIRNEANRIAQQRADEAANKPSPEDFTTAHTGEIKPHDEYRITIPGTPAGSGFLGTGLFARKGTPESSITTTNAADLLGVPGNQITTNTIPGRPAMTWKIPTPSSDQSQSNSQNPLEGKRVRDKVTNKTGVITNGAFVPDDEGNPFDM